MNRIKKYIEDEVFRQEDDLHVPKWHIGHWDKDGRPIPLLLWARLLEDMNYRRVGFDTVKYGFRVSTVWLGIDYGFGIRRLIFETMVFPPHDMRGLYCKRYGTLAEATRNHNRIVAVLKDIRRIRWTDIRTMLDAEI